MVMCRETVSKNIGSVCRAEREIRPHLPKGIGVHKRDMCTGKPPGIQGSCSSKMAENPTMHLKCRNSFGK